MGLLKHGLLWQMVNNENFRSVDNHKNFFRQYFKILPAAMVECHFKVNIKAQRV